MSENWKYQASVKVGDVMHNVRGEDAQEFEANLLSFPLAAAAQFQANVAGGQALGQIVQPQQQEPTQPIVHPSQQAAQPPAWAQPQQPSNVVQMPQQGQQQGNGACELCGKALIHATTRTGKAQLKCPDYKYANGSGNGHHLDWL